MPKQFASLCLLANLWVGTCLAGSSSDPCARIGNSVRATGRRDGLPGDLARDCLLSIPFYHEESIRLGQELEKYLQFQATLDDLTDPPIGYSSRPVKLDRVLAEVIEAAKRRTFATQAEFDVALVRALDAARDGHLSLQPCSLSLFDFYNDLALVSVSEDALQTPKIYTRDDLLLLGDAPDTVSPIASINGRDVLAYINDIPGFHDPDARYNTIFSNPAQTTVHSRSRGSSVFDFGGLPGSDIQLVYVNGTKQDVPTLAALGSSFDHLSSTSDNHVTGATLFEAFCLRPETASKTVNKRSQFAQSPIRPALAQDQYHDLPQPAKAESISGHFSSSELHSDLAILSVSSFDVPPNSNVEEGRHHFLDTAHAFLDQARAAGKSKLIIDLSGNMGGDISLAHGLYRLLFPEPQDEVYSETRFRKHPAIELIGKAISNSQPSFATCSKSPMSAICASAAVKANQTGDFTDWSEFYGTKHEFSAPHAIANFSLMSETLHQSTTPTPRFAPQDIILLTDGLCASVCADFVGFLRNQADPRQRVRSIAFGGRPKIGPMQLVGGSKGAQALSLSDIDELVAAARAAVDAGTSGLSRSETLALLDADGAVPRGLDSLALRIEGGSVGFKSSYDVSSRPRISSGEQTPAPRQFLYEAADCRLFYTREMLLERSAVWERAAWSAWGGVSGQMRDCVRGSRGAPGSVLAGGVGALEEMYMSSGADGRSYS